eukprot:8317473-Alexandrium_andersonii.AAC.1
MCIRDRLQGHQTLLSGLASRPRAQPEGAAVPARPNGPHAPLRGLESAKAGKDKFGAPGRGEGRLWPNGRAGTAALLG